EIIARLIAKGNCPLYQKRIKRRKEFLSVTKWLVARPLTLLTQLIDLMVTNWARFMGSRAILLNQV
ncbi:hypothetical protein PIB30_115276, partial [Stylosanthes scabra]|nr:hypothetical protein [Stylosanthes scabra]